MKQRRPTPAQGLAPQPSAEEQSSAPGPAAAQGPARRPEALPDRARWERAFQAPLGWVQAFMGGPEAEEQLSGEVAVATDGRVYFRDRRPELYSALSTFDGGGDAAPGRGVKPSR